MNVNIYIYVNAWDQSCTETYHDHASFAPSPSTAISSQAAMVLVTCTYNLHSNLYGKRGGRGLLRESCLQASP